MDALECLRNLTAMLLLASAQAVDLRGGPDKLGQGTRRAYDEVRSVAEFQPVDRAMERELASVAGLVFQGALT